MKRLLCTLLAALLTLSLHGCSMSSYAVSAAYPVGEMSQPVATQTRALPTPTPASTSTPAPTLTPAPTPTPEPELTAFAQEMIGEYYTRLINRKYTLDKSYAPENLINMQDYNTSGNLTLRSRSLQMDLRAMLALNEMLVAARAEGITGFYLSSAYRDYSYQQNMWKRKRKKYPRYGDDPSIAISVAPPGASEHQAGLAFDISTVELHSLVETFGETEQGQWLMEHCYEFGFILRYPEGKEAMTGIVFEPWHYRYVGTELACYLRDQDMVMEEFYAHVTAEGALGQHEGEPHYDSQA